MPTIQRCFGLMLKDAKSIDFHGNGCILHSNRITWVDPAVSQYKARSFTLYLAETDGQRLKNAAGNPNDAPQSEIK